MLSNDPAAFEAEMVEVERVELQHQVHPPRTHRRGDQQHEETKVEPVREKPYLMTGSEALTELESGVSSIPPSPRLDSMDSIGVPMKEAINIFSSCNIAIPLAYFCVGFAGSFIDTPLKVYVVRNLNQDADKLQVLKTMRVLPWSFKIIAGLLTDCVPIMSMRRKPYFLMGWLIFFCANLSLAVAGTPSLDHLVSSCFFATVGYVLADVSADSLIVERSRFEPFNITGHMQAIVIILKHFGTFVGYILGTLVYNQPKWGWGLTIGQIFWLQALVPILFVVPFTYTLRDSHNHLSCRSLMVQFKSLWHLMRRRTVWQPMSFVAWYNLCHIPCAAWEPFLLKGLHFSAFELGILGTAGAAVGFLGTGFYKAFCLKYSWRTIYLTTSIVGSFFTIIQLLLIFRINVKWGISDLLFSLGDEVIGDFIMAIHLLPLVNMFLMLCPEGAEGTSFAMITTLSNVARAAAGNIGTTLVKIWDVSNKALKHQDFDGLWKLRLLTGVITLAGLLPIKYLPHSREDMAKKREVLDFWGGVGFLAFLLSAWTFTITVSLLVLNGVHI